MVVRRHFFEKCLKVTFGQSLKEGEGIGHVASWRESQAEGEPSTQIPTVEKLAMSWETEKEARVSEESVVVGEEPVTEGR